MHEPQLLSTFRRVLLGLVFLGIFGLTPELLLLEHAESATQFIPFVVLGVGLVSALAVVRYPTPRTIRAFQLVMLLFVLTGLVGIYLHLRGNVLFEQETNPSARGFDLIWESLHGGIPLLAPAAMSQLGLIGLLFAYRHPASRGVATRHVQQETP